MDILLTIIGAILGWLANHIYSRQGSKELKKLNSELRADNASLKSLVEKLPTDFRSAVANDPRATLTAQQLQDVLELPRFSGQFIGWVGHPLFDEAFRNRWVKGSRSTNAFDGCCTNLR
jgi:hypothetical protein